jgi:hypothetical protein
MRARVSLRRYLNEVIFFIQICENPAEVIQPGFSVFGSDLLTGHHFESFLS